MPSVPDRSTFDSTLNATLHTGVNAVDAARTFPAGASVALDIETPGLERNFELRCVTAAWTADGQTHSVLLDPQRGPQSNRLAIRHLVKSASKLIFHNATYDVPALFHDSLFRPADFDKITDTLLLARMTWPDTHNPVTGRRNLASLSSRLLGLDAPAGGMSLAFKAAGYRTLAAGYEGMDIDSPIYRMGAMSDTVAALLVEPIIRTACRDWLTGHPFPTFGPTTVAEADELIEVQETVNRVMLLRSARGINVDQKYLARYRESVEKQRTDAEKKLAEHGLLGGSGKGPALVVYLDSIGELPADWPKTATGRLQATKELLESLSHPMADAQRFLAETDKVLNVYLDKVYRQSQVTGRCHPQVSVLGASQTGRMSYAAPELQQFSADARPILTDDDGKGLTSIDWSQIEPVTMGLLAQDEKFLAPYEAGEDLYGPIQTAAGVDRKLAKVVLLATMYGQGAAGLAGRIGKTQEKAAMIRKSMLSAMPASERWMRHVSAVADQYQMVPTASGRILPVDASFRAVNYCIQGSAYDVLAHTIVEMKRAGISDDLYLAMHDEVVVSTPVADEVRRIMETPPPWLVKRAGRVPVLRTDREDVGSAWLKPE